MTADTVPLLVRSWKVPLKDAAADTHSGSGNLHRACDRTASRSGRPSCCPATDKSHLRDLPGPSAQDPAKSGRSHCPDDAVAWRRGIPAVTRNAFSKKWRGSPTSGEPRWVQAKGGAALPGHRHRKADIWMASACLSNLAARPRNQSPRSTSDPEAELASAGPAHSREAVLRSPSQPAGCVGIERGGVGGRQPVTLPQGPFPAPRSSSLWFRGVGVGSPERRRGEHSWGTGSPRWALRMSTPGFRDLEVWEGSPSSPDRESLARPISSLLYGRLWSHVTRAQSGMLIYYGCYWYISSLRGGLILISADTQKIFNVFVLSLEWHLVLINSKLKLFSCGNAMQCPLPVPPQIRWALWLA